jgi:hypothetical protein
MAQPLLNNYHTMVVCQKNNAATIEFIFIYR